MIKKYSILLCFIFLLQNVSAAENTQAVQQDDPPNNCVYLSIQISNNTNTSCQLIDKQILHGRMSANTQVPALISAGASGYPFEMRQQFYGPDIILTYECGEGRQISFESHQEFCILNAGEITGSILSATNLGAKNTKDRGSYLWNRHGTINWMISERC